MDKSSLQDLEASQKFLFLLALSFGRMYQQFRDGSALIIYRGKCNILTAFSATYQVDQIAYRYLSALSLDAYSQRKLK